MCITSCGKNVFDFDNMNKKVIFARPTDCMVGCTSCSVWCVFDIITFSDTMYIKEPIKKRGVFIFAKKQLEERLKNG